MTDVRQDPADDVAVRNGRTEAEPPDRLRDEPDVLLDVSELHVDEISLDVEGLEARLALRADVLELLNLHVGVDAMLDRVQLTIKGVQASALLKVRLDNVARILERVLTTIDNNPAIVERLAERVGATVEPVGRATARAVDEVGTSAGSTLEDAGREAAPAVGALGRGAGETVEGVGRQAQDVVEGAGRRTADVVEGAGRQTADVVEGAGEERIRRRPAEPAPAPDERPRRRPQPEGEERPRRRRTVRPPADRPPAQAAKRPRGEDAPADADAGPR